MTEDEAYKEMCIRDRYMTGNDHAIEEADPLELAEIKRRWKPYIDQLPEYAYLCDELLSRRK